MNRKVIRWHLVFFAQVLGGILLMLGVGALLFYVLQHWLTAALCVLGAAVYVYVAEIARKGGL